MGRGNASAPLPLRRRRVGTRRGTHVVGRRAARRRAPVPPSERGGGACVGRGHASAAAPRRRRLVVAKRRDARRRRIPDDPTTKLSIMPSSSSSDKEKLIVELPCPFCGAKFSLRGNVELHISRFHAGQVAFDVPLPAGVALVVPAAAVGADAPGAVVGPVTAGTVDDDPPPCVPSLHVARDDLAGDDFARDGGEEEHVIVVRGASSAPPVRLSLLRPVFHGTTSALVYRYFLGKGDVARAEPLVPAHRQGRLSEFVGDELNAIRMLALSTGGNGMTHKARIEYYETVAAAEVATAVAAKLLIEELQQQLASPSGGSSTSSTSTASSNDDSVGSESAGSDASRDASTASRPRAAKKTSSRKRLRRAIREAKAKMVNGPLTSPFPTAAAFVTSLKGEQDRCLAEMQWKVTDVVEGGVYKFFFRDVMDVAEEAFGRATEVQLRGKRHRRQWIHQALQLFG